MIGPQREHPMTRDFVRPERRKLALAAVATAAALALAGLCARALAADNPPATAQTPMRDPWVPPDLRAAPQAAPTSGAALRAQVERKLKQSFDAADTAHTGAITREQARVHGLGYISEHWDEIDRSNAGVVRFDDLKRFMRERGAKLD